jgi:hypothetical protein
VVGAGAVVPGALPDYSVAVGTPARVIRRHLTSEGWVRVDSDGGYPAGPGYPVGDTLAGGG